MQKKYNSIYKIIYNIYMYILYFIYIYILVGPVAAKHPYKKRCSEGGRGGWQGGRRGSSIIGATLGTQKVLSP